MPKYCPVCFAEYRNAIALCPKDECELVSHKPPEFERLVDCYLASDEIEAERIISLLRDEGIVATLTATHVSQLPAASTTRYPIAVLTKDSACAKAWLEKARKDHIISSAGSFL